MNNLTRRNYNFWDPFFVDLFEDKSNSNCSFMKTDIKDVGDHYEMKIELPDVKKEDIKLSLEDGYLTISANFSESEEEKNKGKVIHRERHFGNFSRSFYVGEELEEKDIKAKLENGVLTLDIIKVEAIKKEKEKKYISIE